MTARISASHHTHTAHKISARTELAHFQKAIFGGVGKMKSVAAPKDVKNATAHFTCTPKGMVDAGAELYQISGKLYVATSDFAGRTQWYEAPAADAKKLATRQKDLYAAAQKLPAKAWSTTAPEFADSLGTLPVTPKGLMGVGTTALIGRDGSVWIKRQAVTPTAKPEYAKVG